jgi:outer membrane lipoprotein carrier protein
MVMTRCFLVLVWLIGAPAFAAGTDRLNAFMTDTRSAKGEFSQRIIDRNGKLTQESRGTLEFARPGKFRWSYVKPYNQLIVGDGTKVWIYDPDLNQVSIRKFDAALGATPAALLSGNNDALKAFDLKDEAVRDGLEWVLATPREKGANFERIRIGLSAEGVVAMELTDAFGQQTVLRFHAMERNPRTDPATFRFTPPKGADVIGE